MDHEISLKNPDEFFNTNMFIDLNDKLCQDKEDNMLEQEILDNYATQILDDKLPTSPYQQSCYQPKTSKCKSMSQPTKCPG